MLNLLKAFAFYRNNFDVYTDGSSKDGKSSWAFVVTKNGKKVFECSQSIPYATCNRVELIAAIEALKYFRKKSTVKILSDSRILVDAFKQDFQRQRPFAYEKEFQTLDALCAHHNVSFHWIKAHSGNAFNERCDELCVESRTSRLLSAADNNLDGKFQTCRKSLT